MTIELVRQPKRRVCSCVKGMTESQKPCFQVPGVDGDGEGDGNGAGAGLEN